MLNDGNGEAEGEGITRQGNADERRANGGALPLDVIFDVLTSSRRRSVLLYLQDREVATAEGIARWIAASEEDVPMEAVAADHRDRVAAELIHTHLPKLADVAVIEYDPRSNTVRYEDPPAHLETILGLVARLEREHGDYSSR